MDGAVMNNNAPNRDALEKELKHAKKMMKTGMIAAFSGGIGLATFLLQKIFSGMAPADHMNAMIDSVCLMLIGYAAAIFVVYLFRRNWLLRANLVLLYVVMPLILLKLFATHM